MKGGGVGGRKSPMKANQVTQWVGPGPPLVRWQQGPPE